MSGCACLTDGGYGEPMEVGIKQDRKARKEHKCVECGRIIQLGETYKYVGGKFKGDWLNFKTCSDCVSMQKNLLQCGFDIGSCWDDVEMGLTESIKYSKPGDESIPWSDIGKCTKPAQNKVFDIIEKAWKKQDNESDISTVHSS